MKLIRNTGSDRVIDELRKALASPSSLDFASPAFSLFAFAELRDLLEELESCRIVFPGMKGRELGLTGLESDRSFRNRLQLRWLARECTAWIKSKTGGPTIRYRSSQRQINMMKNLISRLSPVELEGDSSFAPSVAKELAASTAHPEFSAMEVNSVVSFLKEIEESGECLSIRFDPSSGALLWKEGALELAAPGFFHLLTKIAAKGK